MSPAVAATLLLIGSNIFMTFAWYAHLKNLADRPWYVAAVASWGIASKATELSDFSVCTSWGSTARTSICSMCCAGAWDIPSSSAPCASSTIGSGPVWC